MVNVPIRSRADQFAAFFQSYRAAPVFGQMPASPNGKRNAKHGESKTGPTEGLGGGQETRPEPTAPEGVVEHQGIRHGGERDLYKTRVACFALLHRLQLERGREPVGGEDNRGKPREMQPAIGIRGQSSLLRNYAASSLPNLRRWSSHFRSVSAWLARNRTVSPAHRSSVMVLAIVARISIRLASHFSRESRIFVRSSGLSTANNPTRSRKASPERASFSEKFPSRARSIRLPLGVSE